MEKKISNRTRWSKYHKEPHYSALMQAIKKVRFAGWTVRQACSTYKIPNRSLRRYIEISGDETRRDSPFYIPTRTQSPRDSSKHGLFPPIHGKRLAGATNKKLPACRGSSPLPMQYESDKMEMDCEPATFPSENEQCEDNDFEDDVDLSLDSFDYTYQLFPNTRGSLPTSPSTSPSPVFDFSTTTKATTTKLPAMTDSTTQISTSKGMEVCSDSESQLKIDDSHIQCFLRDISEIDFGF